MRLGPERPRDFQNASSLRSESHRLDAPVRVRNTLDQTVALQEGDAARQRRLVNREGGLQLLQVRLVSTRDGCENAELSHPETARPAFVAR